MNPFRTVHPSWRDAPLAYLDATPPPTRLVEIALGEVVTRVLPSPVRREPEIAAKWSPHVRVRQILGGPATMSSVDVGAYAKKQREKKKEGEKKKDELKRGNVAEIVSYIQLQAALAYPARIGVITFKELREKIEGKLPNNIEWMHYGAVAGRNNMKEVTGLIVLGRPAAPRKVVEDAASVFAGRPIGGDGDWFEYETGGIRRADGTVHRTFMERHNDPIVEALRWQITEGNLIQAIGRLRPHRRDAPCWLDIVTDVPLPIDVSELVQWDDVKPGAVGAMALQGVVLTNISDAHLAFGVSDWAARGVVGKSKEKVLLRDSTDSSPVRKFTYQKDGPGHKRANGSYLPAIISQQSALRAWLEAKLGPLVTLEIEHPTQLAEWQPETMPLGELVGVFGGWLGESGEG